MAANESGVRTKLSDGLSATEIADTCHVMIDTASAIWSNIEFLEDASAGSKVAREAIASDARDSVRKLVQIVRDLRDAARRAAPRAA